MSEIKEKFGERLRELRKERGLSQEMLSKKAGLDRTYEGKIERGQKSPSLNTIGKLAKALEIGLDELFNFDLEE